MSPVAQTGFEPAQDQLVGSQCACAHVSCHAGAVAACKEAVAGEATAEVAMAEEVAAMAAGADTTGDQSPVQKDNSASQLLASAFVLIQQSELTGRG